MTKVALFTPRVMMLLLVATPFWGTGCRSGGWKPSSMFAWNRSADAESLGVEMPTSPAAKYTPNSIASVGAEQRLSEVAKSSGASAYGYTGEPVAEPQAGLAAMANGFAAGSGKPSTKADTVGYQTGPYQVAASLPQGTAGSTETAGSSAYTSSGSSSSLPNPYGGSYKGPANPGGESPQVPDIQLPTSVAGKLDQATQPATGTAEPPSTAGMANNLPLPGYPAAGPTSPNVHLPTYTSPAMPSYPSANVGQTASAGSTTAAYPQPSDYPQPSAYQGANSTTSAGTSPQSATLSTLAPPPAGAAAIDTSGFTPGTTSRSTKYNFGEAGSE